MATNALVTVNQKDMQLVEARLHDKAATTQRAYRRFAWGMLTGLGKPIRMLTPMEVKQYSMSLGGEAGKLAYNINALKSLFTYATELGYLPVNLGKLLKPPKVRNELAKRILSEAEVIRMIDRETSPRNHAILHLLYHAGLRVSEIVSLR